MSIGLYIVISILILIIAMRRLNDVDPNFFDMDSTQPMNGNGYVNFKLHQAFHHYIKVGLSI